MHIPAAGCERIRSIDGEITVVIDTRQSKRTQKKSTRDKKGKRWIRSGMAESNNNEKKKKRDNKRQ